MSTCRKCRWSRIDVGNPTKGLCIAGKYEAGEEDAASGTAQSVIPGKMISLSDKACDKFEDKPSHTQRLREGV